MLKFIRTTLAFCGVTLASLSYADGDLGGRDDVTDEQLKKISMLICMKFDGYKSNTSSIKKKMTTACKAPTEFVCANEGENLSMRGIVRSSIYSVLRIESADDFERRVPDVISELMTHSCHRPSMHYSLDIPFVQQLRNFAKRAIFLGNARSFFDDFIFEEYSTVENGKRKTVIDINAVEYVDGEPETLLDYLDKILIPGHIERLGGSNRGDIKGLRRSLIFYGAKRASELGLKQP